MRVDIERHIVPARKAAGLTQADLADAIGMRRPMLSQIEHGKRALPTAWLERLPKAIRRDIIAAVIADLSAMR